MDRSIRSLNLIEIDLSGSLIEISQVAETLSYGRLSRGPTVQSSAPNLPKIVIGLVPCAFKLSEALLDRRRVTCNCIRRAR